MAKKTPPKKQLAAPPAPPPATEQQQDERSLAAIDEADDSTFVRRNARELVRRCMQGKPYTDRRGEPMKDAQGNKLFIFDPMGAARGLEILGKHKDVKAFEEKADSGHGGGNLSPVLVQFIFNHAASTAKPEKRLTA